MQEKTESLALKLLPADKLALRRLARTEGEAMSVVVRRLIRDAAHEQGLWTLKEGEAGRERVRSHRTKSKSLRGKSA